MTDGIFIQLTRKGRKIYVNQSHISLMTEIVGEPGTMITVGGDTFTVEETLGEICYSIQNEEEVEEYCRMLREEKP